MIFVNIDVRYQWTIALILPIFREFQIWLTIKVASKASLGDFTRVSIATNLLILIEHALSLTIIVGQLASFETSCLVLAIDFLMNIYTCFKLILNPKEDLKMIIGS